MSIPAIFLGRAPASRTFLGGHWCSTCPSLGIVKRGPLQSQCPVLLRLGKERQNRGGPGNGSPALSPRACTVAGVADRSSAGH